MLLNDKADHLHLDLIYTEVKFQERHHRHKMKGYDSWCENKELMFLNAECEKQGIKPCGMLLITKAYDKRLCKTCDIG